MPSGIMSETSSGRQVLLSTVVVMRATRAMVLTLVRRRTWAEFAYALTDLPAAMAEFTFITVSFSVAWPLALVTGGFPITVALYAVRCFAAVERRRARMLLGVDLPMQSAPPARELGYFGWVRSVSSDVTGWRIVVYLLAHMPLAAVNSMFSLILWAGGLGFMSYPLLWEIHPSGYTWGSALSTAAIGAGMLLAAPWVIHGLAATSKVQLRALLDPDAHVQRVRHLETARSHMVDESVTTLRRIERDLHDGAQARMVAMLMRLSVAREELGSAVGPRAELVRGLIEDAYGDAAHAMSDLRNLARGIRPPALERGLVPAIEGLAMDSPVPVDVQASISERPSAGIETVVYFCVSELLTNIVKHSAARYASIAVKQRDQTLVIHITDDGVGGAQLGAGTGLTSLAERVRSVDGALSVHSPHGGPTVVAIELPSRLLVPGVRDRIIAARRSPAFRFSSGGCRPEPAVEQAQDQDRILAAAGCGCDRRFAALRSGARTARVRP